MDLRVQGAVSDRAAGRASGSLPGDWICPSHLRGRGKDRPTTLGSSELAESSGPALLLALSQGRADSKCPSVHRTPHSPGAAELVESHSRAPAHTLPVEPSLHHSGPPSLSIGLEHNRLRQSLRLVTLTITAPAECLLCAQGSICVLNPVRRILHSCNR